MITAQPTIDVIAAVIRGCIHNKPLAESIILEINDRKYMGRHDFQAVAQEMITAIHQREMTLPCGASK